MKERVSGGEPSRERGSLTVSPLMAESAEVRSGAGGLNSVGLLGFHRYRITRVCISN